MHTAVNISNTPFLHRAVQAVAPAQQLFIIIIIASAIFRKFFILKTIFDKVGDAEGVYKKPPMCTKPSRNLRAEPHGEALISQSQHFVLQEPSGAQK